MMKVRREVEVDFPEWANFITGDLNGSCWVHKKEPEIASTIWGSLSGWHVKHIKQLDGFFPDWETSKMTIAEFNEKYGVDDEIS